MVFVHSRKSTFTTSMQLMELARQRNLIEIFQPTIVDTWARGQAGAVFKLTVFKPIAGATAGTSSPRRHSKFCCFDPFLGGTVLAAPSWSQTYFFSGHGVCEKETGDNSKVM